MTQTRALSKDEILKHIPFRPPFLFIDHFLIQQELGKVGGQDVLKYEMGCMCVYE